MVVREYSGSTVASIKGHMEKILSKAFWNVMFYVLSPSLLGWSYDDFFIELIYLIMFSRLIYILKINKSNIKLQESIFDICMYDIEHIAFICLL